MDSKDFDKVILNKIAAGEKMEDIITEFTAVANKIEAQQRKNKSNEEVKKIICGGTPALVADLVGEKINTRALALLLLTWLNENSKFVKEIARGSSAEDFGLMLEEQIKHLNSALEGLDATMDFIKLTEKKRESPKENNKPLYDDFMDFWKKHGIV